MSDLVVGAFTLSGVALGAVGTRWAQASDRREARIHERRDAERRVIIDVIYAGRQWEHRMFGWVAGVGSGAHGLSERSEDLGDLATAFQKTVLDAQLQLQSDVLMECVSLADQARIAIVENNGGFITPHSDTRAVAKRGLDMLTVLSGMLDTLRPQAAKELREPPRRRPRWLPWDLARERVK